MAERHDPYISLRNTRFLWYVASLVAMTLGTQIQATVVAWQVYALTKDPLSLGLVGLAEALPFIAAALVVRSGNIYNGLWYPIVIAAMSGIIGLLFLRETKDADIRS